MGKPITVQRATRQLTLARDDKAHELWKLWPLLPKGLPTDLVLAAMKTVMRGDHAVGVVGRSLPDEYFPQFLEIVEALPKTPLAVAALSVKHLQARRRAVLGEVLKCVGQLGVFSASASQLQARARAFAKNPALVEAARQIVLTVQFDEIRTFHKLMLVSVLMEDASEASMDILVAEAHRALNGEPEAVDQLRECLRWRKTPKPALKPLVALLEATTREAGGASALPSLTRSIGLARVPKRLTASFTATAVVKGGTLTLGIELDSKAKRWWSVEVRRGEKARVSAQFSAAGHRPGWPGLPPLHDFGEYPRWFEALQAFVGLERFETTWMSASSLRGGDRKRLVGWLTGGLHVRQS